MLKLKNSFFYLFMISSFSILILWIISSGQELETGRNIIMPLHTKNQWFEFMDTIFHNLKHPLATLLAQIITIIIVARIFGLIFQKLGQPTVIGEIVAGIVLGPSLLGLYFPEIANQLFPKHTLGNLQFLSQFGLILFMFVVGMELDISVLKHTANEAIIISHASIIIPFTLGMGLAYFIYDSFAPGNVQFLSFSLFIGISMSVTAFPVLARIVQERGMHKSKLGILAITCAAADDITAWSILAVVIAIVKAGTLGSSLYTIGLALFYVFFMLKAVRPFLSRIGELHSSRENLNKSVVAIFFITLLLSAYATEVIGIHALFGAFMAGVIMPAGIKFRNLFIEKVEDVALVLLLPLFFVFTGLRTQIGLLNDVNLWKITGLIIAVAVSGKFIGSALAARVTGQTWKDSLVVGALMNTRGLMELVVLNIGYDLGILSPEIFAMMVIMALFTTFMTGPALDLINKYSENEEKKNLQIKHNGEFNRILIAFGNPVRSVNLLRIANLILNKNTTSSITAIHLTPSSQVHSYNLEIYEKNSFDPILTEASRLHQKIATIFRASGNINADIIETANSREYDLLLIGIGHSIFEGSLLGRMFRLFSRMIDPHRIFNYGWNRDNYELQEIDETTSQFLKKVNIPVGIFTDKGLQNAKVIIVVLTDPQDKFLLYILKDIIKPASIHILDKGNIISTADPVLTISGKKCVTSYNNIKDMDIAKTDLVLISLHGWKKLNQKEESAINSRSVMIFKI